MSELKEEKLKYFSIDEVLGDADWQAAQEIYEKHKGQSIKTIKEKILQEIVLDSMEMINFRTNQQNDANFISYLAAYALLVLNYRKEDRAKINLLNKVDFLGIHLLLHNPDADALTIVGSMSDEEVVETFEYIFKAEEPVEG